MAYWAVSFYDEINEHSYVHHVSKTKKKALKWARKYILEVNSEATYEQEWSEDMVHFYKPRDNIAQYTVNKVG